MNELMTIKDYLSNDYERRSARNANFSLRAYARFLEMDAPNLSKVLKGKIRPGPRLTKRLLLKTGADDRVAKIVLEGQKSEVIKKSNFEILEEDQFQLISRWYYYAIMELFETSHFKKAFAKDPENYKWLAKKLGITTQEVRIAFERLLRLKMIEHTEGEWRDTTTGIMSSIDSKKSSQARRSHQKEILEQAILAMDKIDPDFRDQSSMTMAVNMEDINDVKEMIRNFRRQVSGYLNAAEDKSEVYHLSVSFFPAGNIDKNNQESI